MADDGQSTIVQSFSADLDSMFGLGSGEPSVGVDHLEQTVEEKYVRLYARPKALCLTARRKQVVTSASTELQKLEAKLRETEQRLAQVARGSSPQRQANTGAPRSYPEKQQAMSGAPGPSPLAQKPTYPADRPPTGSRPQATREDTRTLMAGMPGAMPETPRQYSGSNDYVMVDRSSGRSERGYGQSVG